ncbi:Holliday junction branch migration protein RuvA [candidate division KSB1 bacterium]|nr:MAG: Holliday junction branch migration protein RuvA [candidate division KSB1 bacterium 4484_219]RKY74190.1 MAG: Holliday junction branch migration protein RuvA [candidate division KSB1 bacterium]RKY91577.1 MAG: Holliday junction branch migration protein RuvA [candidate division KSB1 bacterium]
MIGFLRGKIIEKNPTRLLLDVNGVGFEVHVSITTYQNLPEIGEFADVLTYLHVRDDTLKLFGFVEAEERELFLKLIGVSGVGPRVAQGILSGISVADFQQAILQENFDVLTAIPGVGRKMAQRLVMDLKEKMNTGITKTAAEKYGIKIDFIEEAVLALVSLGYKRSAAQQAIDKVLRGQKNITTVEELIKKALAVIE